MAIANPVGTNGFEFVEYTSNDVDSLAQLFTSLGFTHVAQHRDKNVSLFQQGNINFLLNGEPDSFSSRFSSLHGPSACGMAFRVKDAKAAFEHTISLGAKPYEGDLSHIGPTVYAIYGIGNSLLYLIDDYEGGKAYRSNFEFITNETKHTGVGLLEIDHLTHNLHQGNMDTWATYYEKLFHFREIRFFDIQGKHTGLISRAMSAPCNKIRIPLNESKDSQSQIEEYLNEYKGEGIQHIALTTENIYQTVETLRASGVDFMNTPDTYYELLPKRLPDHGEDTPRMQKNRILVDGGEAQGGGYLLQIFTNTVIGPIFFEIIQRKGNEGFGEGNFQALFDSIELDQIRRGVLNTEGTQA